MSRYVDADDVLEMLNLMYDEQEDKDDPYNVGVMGAINYIKHRASSIDIVRCKECKHRPIKEDANEADYGFNVIAPNEGERCPCLVEDGWYSWIPKDDFYCGYGEREGE